MKNTFLTKKILCLFLTALMVLSAVFVCDKKEGKQTVYAENTQTDYEMQSLDESFEFSYGDGGYYVSGYKGNQRNIEIPDYYNGEKVLGITDAPYGKKGVFEENKNVISVKMGKNSVAIGKRAFYGCENLESFEFCDDTEYVGRYAFYGCSSLSEISLPSSVNYVGWYAFIDTAWYENAIAEAKERDYESSTLFIKINHVLLDVIKVYDGKFELKNEDGITVFAEYALLNGNRKNITELKEVIIPSSVKYINGYCFGWKEGYKEQSEVTSLKIEGDVIVGEKAFGSITNSLNGKNSVQFGYEKGVHYVGERVSSFSDNVVNENYVTDDNTVIEDCVVIKDGTVEISDGAFALKRAVDGKYSTEYRDNKLIKNVVIPASCKRIGKNAFVQCVNLERVIYLGDGLTIDENAFAGCENLVEFQGIDKVKSIGYASFYECKKLEKVTLVSCEIGAEAFKNCSSLVLTLGSNCQIKRDAFFLCDNVPAVLKTANAENEYYYLRAEENQTQLKVSASKVYIAEQAFAYSALTVVEITADDIVIEKGAFKNCKDLTSVSVNKQIEINDFLFYGDEKLTTLNLVPLGIGEFAFAFTKVTNVDFSNSKYFSAYALTDSKILSVDISGVNKKGVSSSAFFKAESLSEITGDDNDYYSILNGVLYNGDKTEVLCYPAKKSGEISLPSTVKKIGDCAFAFVDFGEKAIELNVDYIGKKAFYSVKSKSVKVNSDSFVIDEKAFYKAETESFSFGEENADKSGVIKYKAFAYSDITYADLSEASLEPMIFKGCASLKKVSFAFKNDLYTNFGCLFGNDYFDGSSRVTQYITNEKRLDYYISAVEEVLIGGDKIGLGAFASVNSLKKVTILDGVEEICSKAFVSCTSLEEVIIPSSVNKIKKQAFNSCKALTEIELPSGVAVGSTAFAYCENLSKVVLKGDAFFENAVFSSCKNLKTVELSQNLSVSDNAYGLLFEYADTVILLNGIVLSDTEIENMREIDVKKTPSGLNKTQKISLVVFIISVVGLIAYLIWAFVFKKKESHAFSHHSSHGQSAHHRKKHKRHSDETKSKEE